MKAPQAKVIAPSTAAHVVVKDKQGNIRKIPLSLKVQELLLKGELKFDKLATYLGLGSGAIILVYQIGTAAGEGAAIRAGASFIPTPTSGDVLLAGSALLTGGALMILRQSETEKKLKAVLKAEKKYSGGK